MTTEFFPPKTDPLQVAGDIDITAKIAPDDWTAGPSSIDLNATYSAAEARLTKIADEYAQAEGMILEGRAWKEALRAEEKNLVRLLKSRTPRRRTAK